MINRLLEKAILFLLRRYVARNGVFHSYLLSFDDMNFLYYWVSHDSAKIVYDAFIEAIEKARTN